MKEIRVRLKRSFHGMKKGTILDIYKKSLGEWCEQVDNNTPLNIILESNK